MGKHGIPQTTLVIDLPKGVGDKLRAMRNREQSKGWVYRRLLYVEGRKPEPEYYYKLLGFQPNSLWEIEVRYGRLKARITPNQLRIGSKVIKTPKYAKDIMDLLAFCLHWEK